MAPAAAANRTTSGAVEAAKHFFKAYNYTLVSLDTKELRRAVTAVCAFWEGSINSLNNMKEDNGWNTGGKLTPSNPWILTEGKVGVEPVFFTVLEEQLTAYTGTGKVLFETKSLTHELQIDMVWRKNRWLAKAVRAKGA